jgi:branched-chain amino acid transport system permease protein
MTRLIIESAVLSGLALAGLMIAAGANAYVVQLLFSTALAVTLAVGWNLIGGMAGYVSFGQVGFFGLGAYAGALAMLKWALPWPLAIVLAACLAAFLAWPLGRIMLRLSGIFFALGMFGLARVLQIIVNALEITGGPMGTSIPTAEGPGATAMAMVALATGAVALMMAISRSRFGLRLAALRDDAIAAAAAGVDTSRVKVAAFCLSAGLAAAAGALYARNVGYIDPASGFAGTIELQTVLMVLAGGIGTVWGPVLGGIVISLLSTALWARFPTEQQIILGALILLLAVAMPGGLASIPPLSTWLRRPMLGAFTPGAATPAPAPAAVAADHAGAVLACRGLGKRFGGVVAVAGVDLAVAPGEILAVIGPNGAGKSTLFDMISAFSAPTSGEIRFRGALCAAMPPHLLARAGIARTFQTSRLFPHLTVFETVLLAAASRQHRFRDAQQAASALLAATDLADDAERFPDALPPGRQRLLEIARALALAPAVLLLDEAMAGMTAAEIARVHAVLRAATRRGTAIVAIEHVLPAIASLAARAQVLDNGQTIAEGPPAQVLSDPMVIEAYLGGDEMALAS